MACGLREGEHEIDRGVALGAWIWSGAGLTEDETVVEVTASGSFDDAKQQPVLAIENHGLVVNHESKVGEIWEGAGRRRRRRNRVDQLLHDIVQEAGQ